MAEGTGRGSACQNFQDRMARRRERDFQHHQDWDNQVRYYEKFDKANNKFEDWASPRYYASNNRLIEKVRAQREKGEDLEKRRAKLHKLLAEDEATYKIELMMKRARSASPKLSGRLDDIPTELLRDVNVGLKLAEDEKKRHEAELNLYHQWRNNSPEVRTAERARTSKDLKLSWLDQQIEKRMARDKEQEECRHIVEDRDERIRLEELKEEDLAKEAGLKSRQLQDYLLAQMEELKVKQELGEELKRHEGEEIDKQVKISELQEKLALEEARRKSTECALYNVRQHKLKLKQKARDVQENVRRDAELVEQILVTEAVERIEDEVKRREVRESIEQFLEFSAQQQQLEKQRQEYLDSIFDSEAKLMYEKQEYIWAQEETARRQLVSDVLDTIRSQIEANIDRSKGRQKEVLLEREQMLNRIESYEKEMAEIKEWQKAREGEIRREIDEHVREKKAGEEQLRALERSKADVELEKIRREEERLKREVVRAQEGRASPVSYRKKKAAWH